MALAAILYDMDGTMVETERQSIEAVALAMESAAGVTITPKDRAMITGRSWNAIYQHLSQRYEVPLSQPELIDLAVVKRAQVFIDEPPTLMPGLETCFERFADLPSAIVTGSSQFEVAQVVSLLPRSFDVVICSEDVASSKPHPEGYLLAAQKLGVAATDCLVLEDSQPGIAAGVAAGAKVIGVAAGNHDGHDHSEAHWQVQTLLEVTRGKAEALW